jgi:hypothetical protein
VDSCSRTPEWLDLSGFEYCFESWYKPNRSNDISYLNGYDSVVAKEQPSQKWVGAGPTQTMASLTPKKAGQLTFHVRALLKNNSTGASRRTYAARHTYLVK